MKLHHMKNLKNTKLYFSFLPNPPYLEFEIDANHLEMLKHHNIL